VELQSRLIKKNYKFGTDTGIEKPSVLYYSLGGIHYINPDSREVPLLRPFNINWVFPAKRRSRLQKNSEIFKIHDNGSRMTYLENSSLEFSSDIQNNSFNKTLLLCLKWFLQTVMM
jgi:hypothetical protein